MGAFATSVFEVFEELRTVHRFVPARAVAARDFASLVRKEADDVFTYVFAHDGRPGNANVVVSMWIAPPDEPSDSLDNLYVGYKIRVGSEFEINDQFFLNCQTRIVQLLACVPAVVPIVQTELAAPAFRTRRWISYNYERKSLALLQEAAGNGNVEARSALAVADEVARGKGSLDKIEQACKDAATKLLRDRLLDADLLQHFEGNAARIASALTGIVYVYALGHLSANDRDLRRLGQR